MTSNTNSVLAIFLLVAHGTADEVELAGEILRRSRAETTTVHVAPAHVSV